MNIAVIMAGGTGARMENALPKQFIELDGETIIAKTLLKFANSGFFDAIYLGIHPDWTDYARKILKNEPNIAKNTPIHIVSGGLDRNSTLQNAIFAIENDFRDTESSDLAHISEYASDLVCADYGIDPIIVTHDAVRPFVKIKMIEDCINAARDYGAATVAIPTTDTIAKVMISDASCNSSDNNSSMTSMESILDRSTLYNIQTPQSFRLSYYRDAYSQLSSAQVSSLPDACGIF